jgi:hypothetical protein
MMNTIKNAVVLDARRKPAAIAEGCSAAKLDWAAALSVNVEYGAVEPVNVSTHRVSRSHAALRAAQDQDLPHLVELQPGVFVEAGKLHAARKLIEDNTPQSRALTKTQKSEEAEKDMWRSAERTLQRKSEFHAEIMSRLED